MKRSIYVAAILVFSLQGCSNDEEPSPNTNTNAGFTWKENGGAAIKADSAFYETEYKTIKAFKNYNDATQRKFIEINLTTSSDATYNVTDGSAISFLYGNELYVASTGMITISSISNKMSGNFTSSSSTGSLTTVEGTFKSIEIR